ncbi:NUDIX hydrolase [Streptomyces sp. N2-109]|uniref:NUDIX hydrolase n=1 Tax=Streptomyces gossypii TaxID=2883101 RepID=A0ABT2JRM3_9ACTN|nr:NUDIX hydrolase [Streptomyces gossypii]MCT2590528.1 NUDIX hydrolase [Streptomyces gossypii]
MAHADTSLTSPPPVRIGALALILSTRGEVLMVRPTYKLGGFYQLPGGCAHHNEPAHRAVVREVREETDLLVAPQRLLVHDWIPANPVRGAACGHNFVYFCGTFPHTTPIRLPPPPSDNRQPELDAHQWIAPEDLGPHCAPYQARRVHAALNAHHHGTFAELAEGHPIYQDKE